MTKRDEIKGLKNQNEYIKEQNIKLKVENLRLRAASAEISAAVDALMVAIAFAYGDRRDNGAREITIVKPDVSAVGKFEINTLISGDKRIISVAPRKETKDVNKTH